MLLLALDTSTSAICAALHDGSSLWSRTRLDPRGHAEWLAVQIRDLLAESGRDASELTHVVAGEGPAPFTGLRVGLVTAETLAFATGAAYGGVCSLDALAAGGVRSGAITRGRFLVATDARRKEIYWATYEYVPPPAGESPQLATALRRTNEPEVAKAHDLPADIAALPALGRGPQLYPQALPHGLDPIDVDAADLARLAVSRLNAGTLDLRPRSHPMYLRRPDAMPAKQQALGFSVSSSRGQA